MPTYDKIPKPTTAYDEIGKPSTRIYPFWGFIDAAWSEIDDLWSAYLVDSFTEIAKPANALLGGLPFFSGGLITFLLDNPFSLRGSYKPETVYTEIGQPPTIIFPFWGFIDANWSDVDDTWSTYQVPSWTKIIKPA